MSPCGRSKELSSSFGLLLDEDDAGRKPDNNVFYNHVANDFPTCTTLSRLKSLK